MHFLKVYALKYTLLSLIIFPEKRTCWDLSVLKISSTYYASSVAVYKNRAFLSLPRSSCFNNVSNPTLVEVPWFNEGRYGVFRKKMYPNYKEQRWGTCKDHQDVVSVDLEPRKAKLWVLDKGNKKCAPKIVIYNLHYNTIGQSSKLTDLPGDKLSILVIDPKSGDFGTRAYIGGMENCILVFSSQSLKTWKVTFLSGFEVQAPISTSYLAMSFAEPVLYMTGTKDFKMHYVDLVGLREYQEKNLLLRDVSLKINVTTVGEKLGPSSGMTADSKGGLYYYLTRDYAVVRWNTSLSLLAEHHDVLVQSYETLPYVSHIFHGPKNTVWALVNPLKPETCEERTGSALYSDMPKLKTRIVKIWRQK